jgi:hypothetical protein
VSEITLDDLKDGREGIKVDITNEDCKYTVQVDLVDAYCDIFKYHWGSWIDWYKGSTYLCQRDKWSSDWEPEEKINYCPFCGQVINVV